MSNEVNHHRCQIHLDQRTGQCRECANRRNAEYRSRERLKIRALQDFYEAHKTEFEEVSDA